MKGVVFVPGIEGTELLYKGSRIWPPDFGDITGYKKVDQLMDPAHVSAGQVIDRIDLISGIICEIIYQTTEEDLQDISKQINGSTVGPYCPVPYDWRVDLFSAVDTLATTIERWYAANPGLSEITIVCHSMGGLLGRLLLEWKYAGGGHHPTPPWFPMIKRLLCVCTPHLGAPKALAESLGLEDVNTIRKADIRKYTADPNFPSGYELLPGSSREILYDWNSNTWIKYDDAAVVSALGLTQANLNKAKSVAAALHLSKPPGVPYMFVYGTGLATDDGVGIYGLSLNRAYVYKWPASQPDQQGDGVVPAWSIKEAAQSANPKIPTWSGDGDHVGILQTGAFRQQLYAYFGLTGPARTLATDHAVVVISLNKRVYSPGGTIEGLIIPDIEADIISGSFFVTRLDERSKKMVPLGSRREIAYRGGAPIRSLPITLKAPMLPGAYRVEYVGSDASHRTTPRTAGWFAVGAGQISAVGPTPPQ